MMTTEQAQQGRSINPHNSLAAISHCPIDLADNNSFADGPPLELFAQLREQAPVVWNPPGVDAEGFWSLTTYAHVAEVDKDWQRFSSARKGSFLTEGGILPREFSSLVFNMMDPPEHDRHRGILNKVFSARAVSEREPDIRRTVNHLLDDVIEQGQCDLVNDIAVELPLIVTANMLGAPIEDRRKLFAWTNTFADTAASQDDKMAAMAGVGGYLPELIASRKSQPTDDLLTRLLHAEVDGQRLNEREVMAHFVQLMLGGSETTRNAYAGGVLALTQHPDQLQLLRDDPNLIPSAVEEILRWHTPIHHQARTATCDVEIGGVSIAENEKVVIWYVSANRDPAAFSAPDKFDVTRSGEKHLSFGIGRHFCLGNQLARLQLRIALEETLRRMADIELAGPIERKPSNSFHWLVSMPVRFAAGPMERRK